MDASDNLRVLLVDDLEIVRSSLRLLLETYDGIKVIGEAASGAEALHQCRELKPDLILLDLAMPDMDGVTTARLLLQEHPNLLILLLTASMEYDLINEALQFGVADYVPKTDGRRIVEARYDVSDIGKSD